MGRRDVGGYDDPAGSGRQPVRHGETIEPGMGVRVHSWSWESGRGRRGGVPWIGIFFVVFGAALLAQEVVPGIAIAWSAVWLAIGLALLVNWVTGRGTWSLYLGAYLTAISLRDVLAGLGVIGGSGWTPLFLGIALLAIALLRASEHRGWGWQLIIGGLLFLYGGAQIADRQFPTFGEIDRLVWPALILVFGLYLVLRNRGTGARI